MPRLISTLGMEYYSIPELAFCPAACPTTCASRSALVQDPTHAVAVFGLPRLPKRA